MQDEGVRSTMDLRSAWRCHVLEADFIDRPLAEIGRSDVRAFLRSRLTRSGRHGRMGPEGRVTADTMRPLSRRSVTKIAHTPRGALAFAVRRGCSTPILPSGCADRCRR